MSPYVPLCAMYINPFAPIDAVSKNQYVPAGTVYRNHDANAVFSKLFINW